MGWKHRWLRVGISKTGGEFRVLDTSKRLQWDGLAQRYVLDPSGSGRIGDGAVNRLEEASFGSAEWGACLDRLGEDGWELVSVVPLSDDYRLEKLGEGDYDTQLWLFKRLVHVAPEPGRIREPVSVKLEGSEADLQEQATPVIELETYQ